MADEIKIPKCTICKRERTAGDGEHKMDMYDYNPMQVINNAALGWYSGDDGQLCPEDMEKMIRG
jgi:hypothetical protein